jgi:hypothetical protein
VNRVTQANPLLARSLGTSAADERARLAISATSTKQPTCSGEKMRSCLLALFASLLLVSSAQAADSLSVRFVGSCSTPGDHYGVVVDGTNAYVAAGSWGLRVVTVADPAHPAEIGHAETPDTAVGLAVSGSYAYVADWSGGLRVISVADPSHPAEVGHNDAPGHAYSVTVNGDYAYVVDLDSGLWVFSVADPAHPAKVGLLNLQFALTVAVYGHFAYVDDQLHGGLRVISVSDPANPVVVGYTDAVGLVTRIAVNGENAFVGSAENGLYVVSVADSAHPTEVGWCNTHDVVNGLALDGYAYAIGYSKLYVISVSDPANPDTVGYYHKPFWDARALAVAGNYVYVLSDSGLSVCQRYDAGIEEAPRICVRSVMCSPTIVRGALRLMGSELIPPEATSGHAQPYLLDIEGRTVMNLKPGANDVSGLNPGVYFVSETPSGAPPAGNIRKIIVAR